MIAVRMQVVGARARRIICEDDVTGRNTHLHLLRVR